MKAAIMLGQLDDAGNEAALIRSAEAFGISRVFMVGDKTVPEGPACGADNHVSFTQFTDEQDLCAYADANNYSIVAIENSDDAEPLDRVTKYPANPIFVVGNEREGVSDMILDAASQICIVRQSPNSYVQCLNATVAGSIVIEDWYQSLL